jgi:hypothetical protein
MVDRESGTPFQENRSGQDSREASSADLDHLDHLDHVFAAMGSERELTGLHGGMI